MAAFDRITLDPDVMGGKPCIRGMRITVGTILGLLAAKHSEEEILKAYPSLEAEDIQAAVEYATRVRGSDFLSYLEKEVWPKAPPGQLGRRLSREEEDEILGYGPEDV
jgi:uncharacterized protein (DUF433 family)